MQATQKMESLSVGEYLEGELSSRDRHEYIGGVVYAMAGSSEDHSLIVGNLVAALRPVLRGGPCRVFATDLKVRLQVAREDIFYYPDLMVACDARETDPYYRSFPKLIVEVLSPSTERTDRQEKLLNYTQIETLEEYVLIAQDRIEVTVFRRVNNWQPEVLRQPDQILVLNSINLRLPLRVVYEDVSVWRV